MAVAPSTARWATFAFSLWRTRISPSAVWQLIGAGCCRLSSTCFCCMAQPASVISNDAQLRIAGLDKVMLLTPPRYVCRDDSAAARGHLAIGCQARVFG